MKKEASVDIDNFDVLKSLIDDHLGNILILDGDGFILFASNSVCRDLGCDKKELIGKHKSFLTEEGYTERSISDLVKQSGNKTFLSVKAYRTGNVMFASSEAVQDKAGKTIFVINRSETERDLLNKINSIYEERFRRDNQDEASDFITLDDCIIKSVSTKTLYRKALSIAKTDMSVVITGAPGTGKEVLARYIFQNSARNDKPFIPVNCAAIPKELMESEFFGYEKGAFTGARSNGKPGFFEIANEGVIFLDEIGELPLALQPKLLRVLDSGEVRRVGGERNIHVDVRIICATNRNLEEMVKNGTFREDLYYRINIVPLHIPPLKERAEDMSALANYFLEKYNEKYHTKKKFATNVLASFQQYSWPGNIRELRNYIERHAALSLSDVLDIGDELVDRGYGIDYAAENTENPPVSAETTKEVVDKGAVTYDANIEGISLKEALLKYEMKIIRNTLKECNGNVSKAAEKLCVPRSRIYRRLEGLEVE